MLREQYDAHARDSAREALVAPTGRVAPLQVGCDGVGVCSRNRIPVGYLAGSGDHRLSSLG